MNTDTTAQAGIQTVHDPALEKEEVQPQASLGLKIAAIATPLMAFTVKNWLFILLALSDGKPHAIQIAEMTGMLIGVVLFPAVVVLLFQIGQRFRNPRSRWTIYFYASLFLLLSNIVNVFTGG